MLPSLRSSALLASSSTRRYAPPPPRVVVVVVVAAAARNIHGGGAPPRGSRRMSSGTTPSIIIGSPPSSSTPLVVVQYSRNDARHPQQHCSTQLPRRHRYQGQSSGIAMMTSSSPHTNTYNDAKNNMKMMMMMPWTTRRWNSGSSGNDDANDGSDIKKIAERRKQDHGHCVEMVRTRDYEGYRKEYIYSLSIILFRLRVSFFTTEYTLHPNGEEAAQLTKLKHSSPSLFPLSIIFPVRVP